MEILLSEQEYNELNDRSKSNDEYIESVLRIKNDFTRAFQVTCKGYEKKKVEVVDIKLDVSDLIGIIIKNYFDDEERKAINNYIDNGNRVKLTNVKMNEPNIDAFSNYVIDRIRKAQLYN